MSLPPNPITATVNYLISDPDVLVLVSGEIRRGEPTAGPRVFGGELPQPQAVYMPRSCVVIRPSGGTMGANYSPLMEQRIDVLCYGATAGKAYELSLVCAQALQNLKRQAQRNAVLYRAIMSGGHNAYRDPGVPTWPITFSTWLIATTLLSSEV